MPTHKVKFVDHCQAVVPTNSYLYHRLRQHFDIEFADDPDFLFYTVFGYEHAQPRYDHCVKIWFTGENLRPDFSTCDYALSFDYLENEPRHLRFPLYVHYAGPQGTLIKRPDFDALAALRSKSRFCNFVYTNPAAVTRIKFFQELSKYKSVDSGGGLMNTIGHRVTDKRAFLSSYKFTIAFENGRYPGYITEKLVEPMLANSIPIYWGSSMVGREFNTRSFLNCHEYASFEDVIEEIVRLDQDDGRYVAKMKEPWLIDNIDSEYTRDDYLVPFFRRVFATPRHSHSRWSGVAPRYFRDCAPGNTLPIMGSPERRTFE